MEANKNVSDKNKVLEKTLDDFRSCVRGTFSGLEQAICDNNSELVQEIISELKNLKASFLAKNPNQKKFVNDLYEENRRSTKQKIQSNLEKREIRLESIIKDYMNNN